MMNVKRYVDHCGEGGGTAPARPGERGDWVSVQDYETVAKQLANTEAKRAANEQALVASHKSEAKLQKMCSDGELWGRFAGYLLDNCEGELIYEESLQRWLADMLAKEEKASGKPYWHRDSPGNATDVPTVEPRQLDNLRHIRLHHWKLAEAHGLTADDITSRSVRSVEDTSRINYCRELSSYHRAIAHSLNDFFPAGDTADKDNAQ